MSSKNEKREQERAEAVERRAEELHRADMADKAAGDRDVLADDQPVVVESSEYDPEFPAMEEYEVDEDGPEGSKSKHPGLIWAVVAIVAVVVLIFAFVVAGDWMSPKQAETVNNAQFEEQVDPEGNSD